MTNVNLVTGEGKDKATIKQFDTFREIELVLKPAPAPSVLASHINATLHVCDTNSRFPVPTEVECRVGRCDEAEFFLRITNEQYQALGTGTFSVELHLDHGDKGYAIYPTSMPFYLTIDKSFKPVEDLEPEVEEGDLEPEVEEGEY